ncbi:ATP synthase F1 subunit delta [Kallotenue papyrolyticum]|uniref:ATP synthase F1 subunit delta n=1 Tax=Kallotenue papyrolyticum TaxID=1325125 RepID=UPI00047867BD|nr:ATP synthase F1 subunit delta [Kallotenue papyrolyticum]
MATVGLDPAVVARALYDSLVQTLRDNDAEDQLDEVVHQFMLLARGSGPREASVTSAVPLSEEQQQAIVQQLRAKYGPALEVEFKVDPSILGGLIVRVGDKVLDESVRSRLVELQQRMLGS